MAHFHEDSDTYYLDQLCLIGLSAAFGGVCLALYLWQAPMLNLMLGKQFHGFVLGSGILLFAMAGIRAVIIWKAAGRTKTTLPQHDHDHDHSHEHEENCEHNHCHDHDHDHAHDHHRHDHNHNDGHEHNHGHEDHDHDWAPWRYVVLLLPIMLFLLGLPNKGPAVQGSSIPVDLTHESNAYKTLVSGGSLFLQQWTPAAILSAKFVMAEQDITANVQKWKFAPTLSADTSAQAETLGFKTLESAARDEDSRGEWDGKWITVKGQFAPNRNNDHQFSLVRFQIRCCGADAVRLNVPMVCKESLNGIKAEEWVNVTGRIRFQKNGGDSYITVLLVPNRQAIAPTGPDPGFYLQ
jgi:uncharacterized protein DUF1980